MNAIEEKELQKGRQRILYDGSLEDIDPDSWPDLFEPAFLEKNGLVKSTAAGRGQVYFFSRGPKTGQKYYPVWDSNPQPSD